MAKKPEAANGNVEAEAAAEASKGTSLRVLGQYVKDLSFENPHAPASLTVANPEIAVMVNVGGRQLGGNDYEVELKLEVKATQTGKAAFMADLTYGGAFRLENIPQDMLQPILLIECPRLLFPFARQVLADATRNGGFPPVMLDPIDFAQLYQRRLQTGGEPAGNA